MPIDGLIILDSTGRPFIQSGFRSASPAYPLLHIDAFNSAASKATRPGDIDPVIYVPPYNAVDKPSACCHIPVGDMRFLCPVSGDVDPLSAFAFLHTFVDILREYFGTVTAATLKENFDIVYQLIEETLDAGGHPLTTSSNALRDIVLPPSLLSKLLSVTGANLTSAISSGPGIGGSFSSPIPWRKAGVKHANNEIYFDMIEELRAIVNKHGTTLSSNVWGRIETNSKLSGTPDCLLTFTNPHVLGDCAFHPCVRLQRWTRDKSLSFVPPDGRFVLLEYRYTPSATAIPAAVRFAPSGSSTPSTPSVASAGGKDNIPTPVVLKPDIEISENTCSFDISLTSRLTTRDIENLVAELYIGEHATAIKCVAARAIGRFSGGGRGLGTDMSASGTGASWGFDPKKQVLRWEIANVPPSSTWTLRGSFNSVKSVPRPAHAVQICFEIPSHTYSALKVEQLRVTGETYKPYKGVRGRSRANIEWRW